MKLSLTFILSIAVLANCITINTSSINSGKIISYSNIPSKKIEPFEYRKTYWYFLIWSISEEKLISDIISEKLEYRPAAKGVRNLEIIFLDEFYDSSQKLYRNPIIAAFALFSSYGYNLYLTSKKTVLVRGEVFY